MEVCDMEGIEATVEETKYKEACDSIIQSDLQVRVSKAKVAVKDKKTIVLVEGDERFSGFD